MSVARESKSARKLHDQFSSDNRFVIDWQTTEFVVKLRDPFERGRLYSILHVTFWGTANVWSLAPQLSRVGIPPEVAYDYVRDCGTLVGQVPNPKCLDFWLKAAELEDFADHCSDCILLIENLAEEIYRRRQPAENETA